MNRVKNKVNDIELRLLKFKNPVLARNHQSNLKIESHA